VGAQHWPAWLGGLSLAAVALGHWLVLGRQLAVSGRFTAIINRLRFGKAEPPSADTSADCSAEAMVDALRAMTADEFGEASLSAERAEAPNLELAESALQKLRQPGTLWLHWLFFGGLALGGFLAARVSGMPTEILSIGGPDFVALFGEAGWSGRLALVSGGLLVGFGTRMAAGCTSGHGLCGVSRVQKGSLVATASFFGAGILVSLALGAWS
jgi:uncharacterized membrane protein YedE/YeeE